MNERVRRPLLTLKLGAAPAKPAVDDAPAAPAPVVAYAWKCRPCGATIVPPAEGLDDEPVRCPACNARVGRAGDFRADPPPLDKLRARSVKVAPPAPPAAPKVKSPRSGPTVVMVKTLKKVR